MNGLEKELKMKLFNQKGLSLVEVMVVIFILGIVTVGIMKQMDFQMKTQSHMNQKMTTDLFNQGLKELLSSEEACKNSLGGIKLSAEGGHSFKELKDHKGKVLYKTTDSTSSSGKNKIDETVKIKSMKVLSFTKDEDENSDEGFLTLEVELEKLNKSIANQVFKRKIDAIRASEKPLKFSITTGKTHETVANTFGYLGRKLPDASYNKIGGSISGNFPRGLSGINRYSNSSQIWIVFDTYGDWLKNKGKKLKINGTSYNLVSNQDSNDESKKRTNVDGFEFYVNPNDNSLFTINQTYEMEIVNSEGNSEKTLSSCRYIGMRGDQTLSSGEGNNNNDNNNENPGGATVPNPNLQASPCSEQANAVKVKCGVDNDGNQVEVAINQSFSLAHQATKHFSQTVSGSEGDCFCTGHFVCDGLNKKSNGDGTILTTGILCIPKTELADLLAPREPSSVGCGRGVTLKVNTESNCEYKVNKPLTNGETRQIYDTEGTYKGSAMVKCEDGILSFVGENGSVCSSSYTCPYSGYRGFVGQYGYSYYVLGGHVTGTSLYVAGSPSVWEKAQEDLGSSTGVPGQKVVYYRTSGGRVSGEQKSNSVSKRTGTCVLVNYRGSSVGGWTETSSESL